jgi:hypothetical protein
MNDLLDPSAWIGFLAALGIFSIASIAWLLIQDALRRRRK